MRALHVTKENSTYQILQALKSNRHKRNDLHEIFVEGVAAINLAIESSTPVRRIVWQDDRPLSSWARRLIESNPGAQCLRLSRQLFGSLSDRNDPSELIVTVERRSLRLNERAMPPLPFVVVVDRPTNHGNLGSIIRSANAFGVTQIITVGHGVDEYDPAVIRASMGAIFNSEVAHVDSMQSLGDWLDEMRRQRPGLRIIATDSAGEMSLAEDRTVTLPAVILVGNEARGLSVQLKRLADTNVRIPMRGAVDSLNVACAASIVMYQVWSSSLSPLS